MKEVPHLKRLPFLAPALLVALACSNALGAGLVSQDTWQRIAPAGESFSVLMPKGASEGSRRVSVAGRDITVGRVYYCLADGKRYLVMSFTKTKPELQDALSSFNSFVLGIEGSLKGPENSLVFDNEVPGAGSSNRQYHIRIGRYTGIARLIGAKNSFYVVAVIGAEAGSPDADQFLSSFTPGPVNTESTNVIVNVKAYLDSDAVSKSGEELPPEPWPQPMRPISGGILNGKAITLARPEYPVEARQSGESGKVRIQIVIDEQGKVIAAKAVDGPKSLQAAALAATWKSRFSPTRLSGQPIKIMGVLEYYFAP